MTQHFEFLVEEPSMEAFLRGLLPRLLPPDRTFEIYPFQGKPNLLKNLEARLRGYAAWIPQNWRIVVVVDRDDDDCKLLKQKMEQIAIRAGLRTKSNTSQPARSTISSWQLVNRIAIEELEAWYFGDWEAVRAAYPRVSRSVPRQSRYRNPEAISGGTSEAFERILQRHGYREEARNKTEIAKVIGRHLDPKRCRSQSFRCFYEAVSEVVSTTEDSA